MLLWAWLLWAWRGATRTPKRREAPPRPSVRPSPPKGAIAPEGGDAARSAARPPPADAERAAVSTAAVRKSAVLKTAMCDAAGRGAARMTGFVCAKRFLVNVI